MSVRESIASNLIATLNGISTLKKVTRDTFDFEKLSNHQFPAVWVQSGSESREDVTIGTSTRHGNINYELVGFVKGRSIDTARNSLIELIEEQLDIDRTRGGNALDTQVVNVETDEGTLEPIGGIRLTVRVLYEFTRGIV